MVEAWRDLSLENACRLITEGHPKLLQEAARIRDLKFGRILTYSPKVFLPVTNLCRDRCSYCTFRKGPKDVGAHTMSLDEIARCVSQGAGQRCHEALLCLGDRPEAVFPSYRKHLGELGVTSTAEYLIQVSEVCLRNGLLPHTNAGLLSSEEMSALRRTNVSMGLMLENISPRLREPGGPHESAPTKDPDKRLAMLKEAGRLRIPFTTGLLVGIGETVAERVETIFAIRDLQREFGHIQEVIVQIFRAKEDTKMANFLEVSDEELFRTVAVTRLMMPDMNVQAPPNLTPQSHRGLIRAGINDWGGISPTTKDFINPEAPWPHLQELKALCGEEGFELRARLPVYDEYIDFDRWIDPLLQTAVKQHQGVRHHAIAMG